jgi:KEOPS complex subunit Pcc1
MELKQAPKYLLRIGGRILNNSKIISCVETEIEIEFQSNEEAEIIFSSIKPEINGSPSDRTSVNIEVIKDTLKIDIDSKDTASFRASLNSYLRWIKLSYDIINIK